MEIGNYLDFDFLIRFLEGLQKFLGEDSEILIHDYRKGYDHTIVYALNADLSGRHVGGSPKGGMITQFGKSIEPLKDSIQTFSNGPKDRFFKSFTTLIPDENGKIIGSVCVNLDVSQLLIAQNALQAFIQHPAQIFHGFGVRSVGMLQLLAAHGLMHLARSLRPKLHPGPKRRRSAKP